METLSYLRGREREIEIGEEYYLGQLWDGDDEDGTPVIVGFTYEELDPEELLDTVVTVTDIF